jgi:tetraacyldisaccharide 4'-kinase
MKMFIPRLFIALCYRAVYKLHHALCLRPGAPLQNSKLIVVGSYRTGGAGKTPFCIWLCKHYSAQGKKVALLAHEYSFDEIALLRQKFSGNKNVQVFATRNRYRLAHELDKSRKFNYIVCDDGFEDSRLTGAVTLLLQWENTPTRISELWPCGKMRSLEKDHKANSSATVALKCYGEKSDLQFVVDKVSRLSPHSNTGEELHDELSRGTSANIVCGLGDPKRFCQDIQDFGIKRSFFFKDHCKTFSREFEHILQKFPQETFIISEKDAARLPAEFIQKNVKAQIYVAHQAIKISSEVVQKLP